MANDSFLGRSCYVTNASLDQNHEIEMELFTFLNC